MPSQRLLIQTLFCILYIDTVTHEIMLSFLGGMCRWKSFVPSLRKISCGGRNKRAYCYIYGNDRLEKQNITIHIEVPPNPFWASVGLSIEPLPIGSGVQYESRVSLGYLNQSFQNAVMEGVLYGCEQGLYGRKVTDCKICFEYGLYYSPVSTPADFRLAFPYRIGAGFKKKQGQNY